MRVASHFVIRSSRRICRTPRRKGGVHVGVLAANYAHVQLRSIRYGAETTDGLQNLAGHRVEAFRVALLDVVLDAPLRSVDPPAFTSQFSENHHRLASL